MYSLMDKSWTQLWPPLRCKRSRDEYITYVRALARMPRDDEWEENINDLRRRFLERTTLSGRSDRQLLVAASLILTDLAVQGWGLRILRGRVQVRPPTQLSDDRVAEKLRIRHQELVKRDAQLRQPAVRTFLQSMERPRVFDGRFTSIFSLMRDGRELANALRRVREHNNNGGSGALANVVDPYLDFVISEEAICPFTGLRLMDIWRYFRHTWSNQYTSVPGRSMAFLVRDRAAPFHPVIGIGALSSPVMQIMERDTWIGWHPDTFLARIRAHPTATIASWLINTVNSAINEIYVDDLFEDGILAPRHLVTPDQAVVDRLLKESSEQRQLHHRYVRSRDHKSVRSDLPPAEYWVVRARTHLFRSKRALALASYLRARIVLNQSFGRRPSAEELASFASTGQGSDAIRRILKKAKADRIGIAVADITVCGAVQPYNAILGGKLVAMLATSPEVILEYRRRYSRAESEIASSMAGRPIVRKPNLVLLGTTSLYSVGSSQYNRIRIPCDKLGGLVGEMIHYEELGRSKAFGTSQYSEETVDALVDLVQQSSGGQRVNSIFGEGVSPKLRKIRQGLNILTFSTNLLLRHYRQRVVYAVSLIRNCREYLLGFEENPNYLVPIEDGALATARISSWWRERWLRGRVASDDVLGEVERHTLVRPIRHGARVAIPLPLDQQLLFNDVM
jgi:Druantia protein DruA